MKKILIYVFAILLIVPVSCSEDILEKGQADLVAIGRGLLADPEFPNKAKEGRFDDIAPCTGCSLGCLARAAKSESLSCVINPAVGKEKEMAIKNEVKKALDKAAKAQKEAEEEVTDK